MPDSNRQPAAVLAAVLTEALPARMWEPCDQPAPCPSAAPPPEGLLSFSRAKEAKSPAYGMPRIKPRGSEALCSISFLEQITLNTALAVSIQGHSLLPALAWTLPVAP